MRYDDRLATVLGQPAADARARAVQWRQLVELVARGHGISDDLKERALARIAQLMRDLPDDIVAATGRAIAGQAVPAELVALFAARGANASVCLLAAADLSAEGWASVRAAAANDVLPLLSALGSTNQPFADRPLPPPPTPAPRVEEQPAAITSIAVRPAEAARAETALPPGLFRWETGPNGEIDWVEGAPRAALVGRSLAEAFADPFAARRPFADEPLPLADEGALAGEWRWSGAPAFFADNGRFAGYRGLARREGTLAATVSTANDAVDAAAEDDGLRELVHELRTPLNAIIGFGEIIEGQYLGPAHRSYRERATEIVRQARSLSDAVDNLDLAARLRSGRLQGESSSGIEVIRAALEDVRTAAHSRDARLMIDDRAGEVRVALPPALAERLVRQFASAMLEICDAGEQLTASLDRLDRMVGIGIKRPTALHGLSEEQILADLERSAVRFALRLVQGVAAMTGGHLEITTDRVVLLLPLAD